MQLTVRDTARLLGVSEKTIYRWVRGGTLPAYKLNEQYRFNRTEILEWATARRMAVAPDLFEEPETDEQAPGLVAAVERGGIHYRVTGADKGAVLAEVVRHMRLPDEVDRAHLLRVVLAREAMASTAVGEGVAFPHVRNPIVLHVPWPSITLCFLERPVDFGALDGQPVHTLFMLVSPTVRAHLGLLSRLAFAVRDPALKAVLDAQGLRDEVLAHLHRIEQALTRADTPAA